MKGVLSDLVGQRFGRLTVIERLPNKQGRVYWKCRCDCGNSSEVLTTSLTRRIISSCGCLHREIITKDLKGRTIGNWTVLSQSAKRSANGYTYWNCRCACGTEKQVCAEGLLSGRSNGCSRCGQAANKRPICLNGHDTSVWGRTDSGACRACVKDAHLRKNYGISLEEFIRIYDLQEGKCAICGRELGEYRPLLPGWGKGSRIEVDHDHKKGKRHSVRGLLCGGRWSGCNRKLGRIDNVVWLQSVVAYLNAPPAQVILSDQNSVVKSNVGE